MRFAVDAGKRLTRQQAAIPYLSWGKPGCNRDSGRRIIEQFNCGRVERSSLAGFVASEDVAAAPGFAANPTTEGMGSETLK